MTEAESEQEQTNEKRVIVSGVPGYPVTPASHFGPPIPGVTPFKEYGDWETVADSNTGVSMKQISNEDDTENKLEVSFDGCVLGTFDQVYAGPIGTSKDKLVGEKQCGEYNLREYEDPQGKRYLVMTVLSFFYFTLEEQ